MNLKTIREYTHQFDSSFEVSPADGLLVDFFDVSFEDNETFDTAEIKYRLSAPNTP